MDALRIAKTYYDAFHNKTDFSEVPIDDELFFQGPSGTIEGGNSFRAAVSGIAQGLVALKIRNQVHDGGSVVSVYDFDLGLPSGPVPMAEVLEIQDDVIRRIDLIFDPARLAVTRDGS